MIAQRPIDDPERIGRVEHDEGCDCDGCEADCVGCGERHVRWQLDHRGACGQCIDEGETNEASR